MSNTDATTVQVPKRAPLSATVRQAIAGLAPKDTETDTSGGTFISPESLTFPTAAGICSALVSSVNVFFGGASHNIWIVLGVSVVVGVLIVVLGWPGVSSPPRQRVVYAATGALNILLLFASVMGITSMTMQSVPGVVP